MNVVVIGGAGFIGSHLVDRLLAGGHSVDVIDDLSAGSLGNLADARASGGAIKIHHLDGRSAEAATLIGMRRPDVIHDLSLFDRLDRSARAQARGFDGALATLEAARRHGVGKVVVAVPATALYGQPAASMIPVKEAEPVPRGVRGVVARGVIDLLATYREQHAVEFAALALPTVYGPRQHPEAGVVARLYDAAGAGRPGQLDGGGRQTRDLLYVDDAVDAFVRAAQRGSGLVVNIGTGVQTTVRDVWAHLAGDAPSEVTPERPDDLPRFAVSPARARIHLGWSSWTAVADGLGRLSMPQH